MTDFSADRVIERTRRDHECYECKHIIPAGSRAAKRTGRFDGYFYSHYAHWECDRASVYYTALYVHNRDLADYGWSGLQSELSQFGSNSPEFAGVIEMLRKEGLVAVADRLMK